MDIVQQSVQTSQAITVITADSTNNKARNNPESNEVGFVIALALVFLVLLLGVMSEVSNYKNRAKKKDDKPQEK